MSHYTKAEQAKSRAWLLEHLQENRDVFASIRHISRSGMQRQISFLTLQGNEPRYISWHIACVLDYRTDNSGALIVTGTRMDMAFHIIHSLAHELYGDSYSLNGRIL